MENSYKKFYRHFYLKTGGFIPGKPLNKMMVPGDYFQIKNGEIIVLGNLYQKLIIHPQDTNLSNLLPLNPPVWNFSDGISKPYSGRGHGHGAIEGQFEFSKQVLSFADRGSFIFKAEGLGSVKIMNWNEIQEQLIIKMTQTYFSFREVYVVTESVSATPSTLAIAGEKDAELELANEMENFGLVDIFGHPDTKTIQTKDIEYYHRETLKRPLYFKAKKLAVQDDKLAFFISDFIDKTNNSGEWAGTIYSDFDYEAYYNSPMVVQNAEGHFLDMLQANELNPNTALSYFKWTDANLDDIEKLFPNHGN